MGRTEEGGLAIAERPSQAAPTPDGGDGATDD